MAQTPAQRQRRYYQRCKKDPTFRKKNKERCKAWRAKQDKKVLKQKAKQAYEKKKEQRKQEMREYYQEHKETMNKQAKQWRKDHKEYLHQYDKNRQPIKRIHDRTLYLNKKIQCIFVYTNGKMKCSYNGCDIDDVDLLTIDHIEGGGRKQLRDLKITGGKQFYTWLIRNNFPDGYRVLCFNHNFKEAHNKNYFSRT